MVAINAVLSAFEAGQGGGEAVVSLILGERNLWSFANDSLCLRFHHEKHFTDHSFAAFPGRGARFLHDKPAFRFGHSLSYTNWSETVMASIRVLHATDQDTEVHVTVEVKNVGPMRGDRSVLLSMRRQRQMATHRDCRVRTEQGISDGQLAVGMVGRFLRCEILGQGRADVSCLR